MIVTPIQWRQFGDLTFGSECECVNLHWKGNKRNVNVTMQFVASISVKNVQLTADILGSIQQSKP